MALSQYLLNEILDDFAVPRGFRPGQLFDQDFGLGVLHDDLVRPLVRPCLTGYVRPWRHQAARNSGVSHVRHGKDGFKVNLDVQQFKPEEINVKVVDNSVVVEGKHEERADEHGHISRHFTRRYRLPEDINLDAVVSKLSSDGVLSIEAPKKAIEPPSEERAIPITLTNAPAVASSAPQTAEKKDSDAKVTGEQMDQ